MNLAKLKGVLVEKGGTYADMAEVLGISKTTVVNKLSGRSDFDINEANKIANWLGLSTEERLDIFFCKMTCIIYKFRRRCDSSGR